MARELAVRGALAQILVRQFLKRERRRVFDPGVIVSDERRALDHAREHGRAKRGQRSESRSPGWGVHALVWS